MKTQKAHSRPARPIVTATRASQLCALRAEIDEERLELGRAATTLENEIKKIDRQLIDFAKDAGDPPICDLARYQIAVVQVDGFFSYKDNLIDEIGFDEFERRRKAVPTKDDLQIIEKRPATSKAVVAAREKASSILRTKAGNAGSSKGRAA